MSSSVGDDLRLEELPTFSGVQQDWDALAEQAGNFFASWDWASTWWRHFSTRRALLLRGWRSPSGQLVGILPLCVQRRGLLRTIRFIGSGISQQLGPICGPEQRPAAARALRLLLNDAGHAWDVFVGEDLPAENGWAGLVGGTRIRTTPNPILPIESSSWRQFLGSRSANFRRQLTRQEQRLRRSYDLRFRLADDPERLEADLDVLFTLHRARWGARRSPFSAAERFHRDVARSAQSRGRLRLWLLELDRHPAAALYGFRFAGVEWFFQSGRDPELERYSPGFVLLGHAVQEAVADGIRECDFLRGDDPYKLRFATELRSLETIAVARGIAGRSALRGARLAAPLPFRIRRGLAAVVSR